MSITYEIIKSWGDKQGNVNSMETINNWISERNKNLTVDIKQVDFSYDGFWYYDPNDGYIKNKSNSFFQLAGYQEIDDNRIINEQPIIIQNEIGYLGIICKMINNELNFLMQAKIEPGNINVIQISPTIQATKSNFTRMHGGDSPAYLDYFINSGNYKVIVDQIQSEQSSRFYKKRNRNIIIYVEEDVEVLESHMWMTLGQIKELMKIDNLVNMDTRTVLSCIPLSLNDLSDEEHAKTQELFSDTSLFNSIFNVDSNIIIEIFNAMNDYKMFNKEQSRLVPIKSLKSWKMNKDEIVCKNPYDFRVIYCLIEIEGREVKYWEQPLIASNGIAIFGIFTCVENGVRKYLIKLKHEIGCFDEVELGPTIQMEPTNHKNDLDDIEKLFISKLQNEEGIVTNVILSEEGGRFYHEQNQNVIIELNKSEIKKPLKGYFWVNYSVLNKMIGFNNCLNIQLRNILSLITI